MPHLFEIFLIELFQVQAAHKLIYGQYSAGDFVPDVRYSRRYSSRFPGQTSPAVRGVGLAFDAQDRPAVCG